MSGSLRATDTIYSTTNQFQILKIPTSSNGTTYGSGTSGQILKSNGTSVYWAADNDTKDLPSMTGTLGVDHGGTGATSASGARTNLGLGSIATETAANYLKWQTTSKKSTELYDFGVYVNQGGAAQSGPTNNVYFALINIPYNKASGNTTPGWSWQIGGTTVNDNRLWFRTASNAAFDNWQEIAHAPYSTNDIGSATQPVYMTSAGVITAGTALKALAYKDSLVASDIPELSTDKLTSGTLPVGRGGTGQTTIANIQAGKDGDGNTISSTYLKLEGGDLTGDLGIIFGDTNKFLHFKYGTSSLVNNSWRLGVLGTGSGDENYFVIQSGGVNGSSNSTWNNAIRIGQQTYDVAFGGNVYPLTDNSKTLGTSSYKWSNVYATIFTGNLTGNVTGNVSGTSANVTGTVAIEHGGTNATTAAGARTNLGLGEVATYNLFSNSSPWWATSGRVVPTVGTDGVIELGKYIDFHSTREGTTDYDVRITAKTTGLSITGTTSGTFSGSLNGINFITNTGSLASNGWETLGGQDTGLSLAVSYNTSPAAWNSGTYSSTIVFGGNNTKGYIDCAHTTPIVTIGGASISDSTNDAPTWYFKLSGTSAQTYDLNNLSYIQYDSTLHAIKFIVP